MVKKGTESAWGGFAVVGTQFYNEDMKISRIEWITKYVRYGAKFCLVREPDNVKDPNAIKVKHALKSGKKMTIGYVPNSPKRKLADEWAPLMDKYNWNPKVVLGHKLIVEEADEERGREVGDCYGLIVRYAKR